MCLVDLPSLSPILRPQFHALLTYDNAALEDADAEKESAVDAVKSAACQVCGDAEACQVGVRR